MQLQQPVLVGHLRPFQAPKCWIDVPGKLSPLNLSYDLTNTGGLYVDTPPNSCQQNDELHKKDGAFEE